MTTTQYDIAEHTHPTRRDPGRVHTHAWGSRVHSHMLRAICGRDECCGVAAHDIHPGPEER